MPLDRGERGDEATVRQRLSQDISKLTLMRHNVTFEYPFSPKEVVAFFRQYFGASQLERLWAEHNQAKDGTTRVEAEYLDVRAIRA